MRRLFIIFLLTACSDPVSHLYEGRFYAADRKCLGTTSSIDVVEGGDTGTCSPVCLIKDSNVYVGTSCPPFPPGYDTTGTSPVCVDALAANARDDTCLVDGGSTHP